MRMLLSGLMALCLATSGARGHTMAEESFTCPIDGKKFQDFMDMSGTQFGMRLDFKPLGPTAAPWKVAQCPKCHYVFFEEKPDAATIAKLKPYILSQSYQSPAKGNTTYYCLAKIREFLGEGDLAVGNTYVRASWQVDKDSKRCAEYEALALEKLTKGLAASAEGSEELVNVSLLCGELERRLGKFEDARKRFEALEKAKGFQDKVIRQVIDRQLDFIAKKDGAPHAIVAEQEEYVSE